MPGAEAMQVFRQILAASVPEEQQDKGDINSNFTPSRSANARNINNNQRTPAALANNNNGKSNNNTFALNTAMSGNSAAKYTNRSLARL